MFSHSHHLNGIVAILLDAWQDVVLELGIGSHLLRILCHTDVALVDEQRIGVGLEVLLLEFVRLGWSPNLSGENLGRIVLHHTVGIGRNALPFSTIPLDFQLEEVAVMHLTGLELDFPIAVVDAFHLVGLILLPIVEIANQIDVGGIGCPLAQHPTFGSLVQTKIEITAGEVRKRLLAAIGQFVQFPEGMVMTTADGSLERFEPRVILHDSDMLYWCLLLLGSRFRFLCCSHYL